VTKPSVSPSSPCTGSWPPIHLLISALYELSVCLLNFLTYFFPSIYFLIFSYLLIYSLTYLLPGLCYCVNFIFLLYLVTDACLLLLCFVVFLSTKPRDWLRRTSPKWPVFCRMGRKTLTQSTNREPARRTDSPTLTKLLESALTIGAIWQIWLNRNTPQSATCSSSCAQHASKSRGLPDQTSRSFYQTDGSSAVLMRAFILRISDPLWNASAPNEGVGMPIFADSPENRLP